MDVFEPRLWRNRGWTARVVRAEQDDGWAVEMTREGDTEPALVGPWTMGRDKKNPKPLDAGAFTTLVKTASEVLRRHEHHERSLLHKNLVYVRADGVRVNADLDMVADELDPHAMLVCTDDITGEALRSGRVSTGFRMNASTVERFLEDGDT